MKQTFVLLWILLSALVLPAAAQAKDAPFTVLAGDVLQITVWKEDGMDREVVVLPDGSITFPLIGAVKVQGLTPESVQALVKTRLKKYIPDAAVTVSVKAALGHTVNVIGQVVRPGEFIIGRRMTVMQALSQAGGLTPYAKTSRIIVIRHGQEGKDGEGVSIPIPYNDLVSGEALDKDLVLQPGDVIVVPTASLF